MLFPAISWGDSPPPRIPNSPPPQKNTQNAKNVKKCIKFTVQICVFPSQSTESKINTDFKKGRGKCLLNTSAHTKGAKPSFLFFPMVENKFFLPKGTLPNPNPKKYATENTREIEVHSFIILLSLLYFFRENIS